MKINLFCLPLQKGFEKEGLWERKESEGYFLNSLGRKEVR
jgi:hypothetical protein